MKSTWIAVLALLFNVTANAQTIYRCGHEYTRMPCLDGKPVDAEGSVSGSQRAEADRIRAEERRLGRDMEEARRRQEASIKPARASSFSAPKPVSAAASAPHKKIKKKRAATRLAEDDDFIARGPGTRKRSAPDGTPSAQATTPTH